MEINKMMETNSQHLQSELSRLKNSILHIKEIVSMQNTLSGVSKIIETISISELIDTAMQHIEASMKKNDIQLEKKYEENLTINTDKNKIMQIVINLLQNAKDALIVSAPGCSKKITIST